MMKFKKIPASLIAAGMMTLAAPQFAQASELDELKAMVQQLSAKVTQLEEQQKKAAAVKAVAPNGAPAATSASIGSAQGPLSINVGGGTVSMYGDIDIYANYMKSSSGAKITDIQDGAYLRSRLGFKGDRAVADGYTMKFQLEQGLNITNGTAADTPSASSQSIAGNSLASTGRLFDRQAWAGIATPYGEFRVGRQNTAIFYRGDYIDYGSRTLGGMINNFGVPSRYDGDLSYQSPRLYGFQAEVHYAVNGATVAVPTATATTPTSTSLVNMGVYQFALDYLNGPYRVGYAGIGARPNAVATTGAGTGSFDQKVVYHNMYANYDYGRGKVYLAYVRSNNKDGALSNVGGNVVGNAPYTPVGSTAVALDSGLSSTVNNFFNIWQISADYKVSDKLRIGGLYGKIEGPSGQNKGANGWSLGAFYDIFQNTTVYALVDSISNESAASFTPSGSAGLTKNFNGTDSLGQKIDGVQAGFVFKF